MYREVSTNGQHAVRKQWTGWILGPNDAIPKAIKPIQPAKITNKYNTTAITETIGVAAMDGIEIGSDKTAEKAAMYVEPIYQKIPSKFLRIQKVQLLTPFFFDSS